MLAGGSAAYTQVVLKVHGNQPTNNGRQVGPTKIVPPGAYPMQPDNMPCVVPDMATVKGIPNSVKPGDEIQFIPNGYRKEPIVVSARKQKTGPRKLPK
jgi:hypothetical protein